MATTTVRQNGMTSILIRIPVSFKKTLDRFAKHESMTRYIVDAVQERMRLQKLNAWVKGYFESEKTVKIRKISRAWPKKRFYHSQTP